MPSITKNRKASREGLGFRAGTARLT